MTQIKFCGLKRTEDIEQANELKPDYIGFVFVENSKRYINPIEAHQLRKKLDPSIKVVGVFVDEEIEIINDIIKLKIIDVVQLHGTEDENYIQALRKVSDVPIIKAFNIQTREACAIAEKSKADYILLDSKTAGSGTQFDWNLLKDIKRDYFLAGGLNPENVYQSIQLLKPFAVDVSSGIETSGVKDKDKMTAFVQNVRKADLEVNK